MNDISPLIDQALADLGMLMASQERESVNRFKAAIEASIAQADELIAAQRAQTDTSTPKLSAKHLRLFAKEKAQHLSELRRINSLFWEHRQRLKGLKDIPSTPEEMENDWLDACAFTVLKIIEGEEIDFRHVDPASYSLLEEVWLKRVKQLKAYYIWTDEHDPDSERNYHRASAIIRSMLLTRPAASLQDFERVREYIETNYLASDDAGRLDEDKPATKRLIAHKAERISKMRGGGHQNADWFRAKLYVQMYYENIIDAVRKSDKRKTLATLKAFTFSKAPRNRYLIINGFETAVAIGFLNKDVVREVLKTPELFDFSMEPVDDWPTDVPIPAVCRPAIQYDTDDQQLVCEGIMSDAQRKALLAAFPNEDHRAAIEQLFQQSQARPPLEDTIL